DVVGYLTEADLDDAAASDDTDAPEPEAPEPEAPEPDPDDTPAVPGWLTPITPKRLLDTRASVAGAVDDDERTIPGAVGDLLVNLAAVADDDAGFLQAGACGTLGADTEFSNVNYAGRAV